MSPVIEGTDRGAPDGARAGSVTQYAAHRRSRGLVGGSVAGVVYAIKRRALTRSVRKDAHGRSYIADFDLADAEWLQNTRSQYVPHSVQRRAAAAAAPALDVRTPEGAVLPLQPSPGPLLPSGALDAEQYARARARREQANAELAEFRLHRERDGWLQAAIVEERVLDLFIKVRNRLLATPHKFKQRCPDISHLELATLDELLREAMEEIADTSRVLE
jgi:hypothetical protein